MELCSPAAYIFSYTGVIWSYSLIIIQFLSLVKACASNLQSISALDTWK